MGLDIKNGAKTGGLLHDIGKVVGRTENLGFFSIGMDLAVKYKEHPVVCNAIGAHHDEIEMTSLISPISLSRRNQQCPALECPS